MCLQLIMPYRQEPSRDKIFQKRSLLRPGQRERKSIHSI
jgi:hypothetical protein